MGEELKAAGKRVVVCDLWTAMMERAGWRGKCVLPGSLKAERNAALAEMLYDGTYATALDKLHFTKSFADTRGPNLQVSTLTPPVIRCCTMRCAR